MSPDTKLEVEQTSQGSGQSESELKKNFKDRLLLPVAIPVVVAFVVALLGVSFSRIFLAGANKGAEEGVTEAVGEVSKSPAPVIWAIIFMLVILIGAAGLSMMSSMKTTSFALVASGAIVAVIVAGSVLAGAGDVHVQTEDFGKPTEAEITAADPANKVEIDALGTNQFQSKEFSAKPGTVLIDYVGKGGTHNLKIKDTRYSWFFLEVNAGTTDSDNVNFETGTYYLFCAIPGHEAAGMHADLVVK